MGNIFVYETRLYCDMGIEYHFSNEEPTEQPINTQLLATKTIKIKILGPFKTDSAIMMGLGCLGLGFL